MRAAHARARARARRATSTERGSEREQCDCERCAGGAARGRAVEEGAIAVAVVVTERAFIDRRLRIGDARGVVVVFEVIEAGRAVVDVAAPDARVGAVVVARAAAAVAA